MDLKEYKRRMAELGINRENLEKRIKPFYECHPREWKQRIDYAKSKVPLPPPSYDLSHLNPKRKGRKT